MKQYFKNNAQWYKMGWTSSDISDFSILIVISFIFDIFQTLTFPSIKYQLVAMARWLERSPRDREVVGSRQVSFVGLSDETLKTEFVKIISLLKLWKSFKGLNLRHFAYSWWRLKMSDKFAKGRKTNKTKFVKCHWCNEVASIVQH